MDKVTNIDLQLFAEGQEPGAAAETTSGDLAATEGLEDAGQDSGAEQAAWAPEEAQKEIQKLRREAAKYRTKGREMEDSYTALKATMAKALGLQDDTGDKALETELAGLREKYHQERLKGAYYRAAQKAGADVELTWAYLYANNILAEIDVGDDGFEQDVEARIMEALAKNSKLKAAYGGAASGGANPPGKDTTSAQDEYQAARQALQQSPNDQMLRQRLFLLKERLGGR